MNTNGFQGISLKKWEDLSHLLPATLGWLHSGIAIDNNGTLFCAHPDGGDLLVIDSGGNTVQLATELAELHSISLTNSSELLAVADPGWRMCCKQNTRLYKPVWTQGHAVLLNKNTGVIEAEINQPEIEEYQAKGWRPTSIAVNRAVDSEGEIWIADGYGENLVHKFSSSGEYILTIDGSTTGKALDCPHGVFVRTTENLDSELLIADRGNHRILVFDTTGKFKGEFGASILDSPSSITELNNRIYVTELHGGISCFGQNNAYLGNIESSRLRDETEEAWPNTPGVGNELLAPELLPNFFNSPHGITTDGHHLFVTEWLIGGRLLKLTPA